MTTMQPLHTENAAPDALVAEAVSAARAAQRRWDAVALPERLRSLRRLRHRIAIAAPDLAASIASTHRTSAEKLASEVIPLADAIRFLELAAPRLLRPTRYGRRGRPLWLGRVQLEVRREPFGVVLIVAPSNYPLFLPAVQAVQALAAGNAVLIKPAPGHTGPVRLLQSLAELPPDLFQILPEEASAVEAAVRAGVDKVIFTGSADNGATVLSKLAEHLVPSTMELSGHDAVFVCDDAELDLVARSVAYGLAFNGGATCIAPRRVFVPRNLAAALESKLAPLVASADAGSAVTIVPVADLDEALKIDAECPYALGASIFGSPASAARVVGRVNAGCVVINDVIVPTADPRLPFGGRGRSGFGVTRGAEGLLEMTRLKAVTTRAGSFRPHLQPPHPLDGELFRHYLAAAHGPSLIARLRGAINVVRTLLARGRTP